MSIRLITTYQEAKALKKVGWPQAVADGQVYYHEVISLGVPVMYRGSTTPQELVDCETSAPRLDELLAWLWDCGWEVGFRDVPGDEQRVETSIWTSESAVASRFHQDRLAGIVDAVIYVLTEKEVAA